VKSALPSRDLRGRVKHIYTLADLQDWTEATRGLEPPIRLGILGDPVDHSLSPQMQNAALDHDKINMQYARFHIHADELQTALALLPKLNFVGVNLTLPHKIAALGFVKELDDEAKQVGAINTIVIRDKTLIGFNTDGVGFVRAIRGEFSVDLHDMRVMILGAGGAGRAIAVQCALQSCERLVLANRTFEKARQLADELRPHFTGARVFGPVARLQPVPWEEAALRSQIGNVDLIVNATRLGLKQSDPSPLPARSLAPHLMVYDTVYAGHETRLLAAAKEVGARAADGRSMLVHQGARAFEVWFERPAPLDAMRAALVDRDLRAG
jgi:shikimate dehydrogenase